MEFAFLSKHNRDRLTVCTIIIPSIGTAVADLTVTPVVGGIFQNDAASVIFTRVLRTMRWNTTVLE